MARVILIDDDVALLQTLKRMLEHAGHEVRSYTGAQDALEAFKEDETDVIVSDLRLVTFGGLDLVDWLHKRYSDIPLILITRDPAIEDAAATVRHQPFDYLIKPVSSRALCASVASAARMKTLIDENRNLRDRLDERVRERTAKLMRANADLQQVITHRKQAEDLLRKERDINHALIQASPAFLVSLDHDFRVLMMNHAMLKALGYTFAEIQGVNYLDHFVHHDDRTRVKQVLDTLVSGSRTRLEEHRLRTKHGLIREVQWSGRAVFAENGHFEFMFGMGTDMTDSRHTELALKSTRQQFADIISFLPDATMVINREGYVIAWNRAMEKLTGRSASSIIGKGDFEYALPFYGRGDRS